MEHPDRSGVLPEEDYLVREVYLRDMHHEAMIYRM
jgi:hypothetical protein